MKRPIYTHDNDSRDRIARIVILVALFVSIVSGYIYYIHCKHEQRVAKVATVEQVAAPAMELATVGKTNAVQTNNLVPMSVTIKGQFKE